MESSEKLILSRLRILFFPKTPVLRVFTRHRFIRLAPQHVLSDGKDVIEKTDNVPYKNRTILTGG
jgi:hypothetical protein